MTRSITNAPGLPLNCPQDTAYSTPRYPLQEGPAGSAVKNADDPRRFPSGHPRTPMLVRANSSELSRKLHPIQDADKGHVSNPFSPNCKRVLDEDTGRDSVLHPKKVDKTSLWLIQVKWSKNSSRRLAGHGLGSSFPARDNNPRDNADGNNPNGYVNGDGIAEGGSSGGANGNGPDGNANGNSPDANANANQNAPGGNANGNDSSNGDGNSNGNGTPGSGGTGTSGNPGSEVTGTSSAPGEGATGISGGGTPSGGSSGSRSPSGSSSGSGPFNNFAVSSTVPSNGNPSPTPTPGGSSGSGSPSGSISGSGPFNNFAMSTSSTVSNNGNSSPTPTSGGSAPGGGETGISGGTPSGDGGDNGGSVSPSGSSSSSGPFNNVVVSTSTIPDIGNPSPTPSSGGSRGNDIKPERSSDGPVNSNRIFGNASATNQRAGSPTPTRAIVTISHGTGFNAGHGAHSESSLHGGWTTISSVSSFTSIGITTMTFTSGSSVFTTMMSTTTTGVTTIGIATYLPEKTPQHHPNAGTITGALLGSIFGLLLILSLLLCYRRRRQKQRKIGFLYLTPGPDTNFTDRFHVNTSLKTKPKLAKRNMSSVHISSPVLIGQSAPSAAGNPAYEPVSRKNIEIRVMQEVQNRSSLPSTRLRSLQNKPGPPSGNLAYESATDTGMSQPDLIWFPTDTRTVEDPFDDRFQIQPSSTTATR